MGIKSQYSIEFIMMFAFSLLIVMPLISVIHSEYNKSKDSLDNSQVRKILDEISIAAQNVYYSGYPSKTTLDLHFPTGIEAMETQFVIASGKSELRIKIDKSGIQNEIVSVIPFEIVSNLSSSSGRRYILVKAEESGYVNITG